uniref:Chitin-binding type-2 domain-containing protein n=1 Tax=Anopheles epiroticus TaxID=199890 RepID=A0A182PSC6_9DIPT
MLFRTVFITILVSLLQTVAAQELTESLNSTDNLSLGTFGTLLDTTPHGLQRQPSITGMCDGVKQLVCDTCNTLRVCLGAESGQEKMITCPNDQPYCNYGTTSDYCSTVPIPNVCNEASQNAPVTCSAVGTLPDASNCRIYHGCTNVGQSSSIYSCPTGYVFNAALELCALENVFSRCVNVQCTTGFVGHVRYGQSQRFYGLCDGTGQAIMYKCPTRASFAFITGSTFGECSYLCPGQGNFPNSNDPATYFQCFWENRRLRYNLIQIGHCSPVLVLVANGSDITINFPGENNNNRVFSIVSSSGNNNPSMYDWIGGSGANKAPTIMLGKSNAPASFNDDNSEENGDNLPLNRKPLLGPHGFGEFDATEDTLPLVTTAIPIPPVNGTTASAPFTDKVLAAPV